MSFASVKAIIDGHAYASLIGLQEDAWLEAKSSTPYDLDTPEDRYELAKDVAAFASGTGGFVIVGLQTIRHATTQTDEISSYDLMRQKHPWRATLIVIADELRTNPNAAAYMMLRQIFYWFGVDRGEVPYTLQKTLLQGEPIRQLTTCPS